LFSETQHDAVQIGSNFLVAILRMISSAYMLEVLCLLLVVCLWSAAVELEQPVAGPGVVPPDTTFCGF